MEKCLTGEHKAKAKFKATARSGDISSSAADLQGMLGSVDAIKSFNMGDQLFAMPACPCAKLNDA